MLCRLTFADLAGELPEAPQSQDGTAEEHSHQLQVISFA